MLDVPVSGQLSSWTTHGTCVRVDRAGHPDLKLSQRVATCRNVLCYTILCTRAVILFSAVFRSLCHPLIKPSWCAQSMSRANMCLVSACEWVYFAGVSCSVCFMTAECCRRASVGTPVAHSSKCSCTCACGRGDPCCAKYVWSLRAVCMVFAACA